MLEGFFIPFVTIAVAELFDKSQLAILLLASRTKKRAELFFGVVLAFALLTAIAILTGGFLTTLIPESYLRLGSSLLFILFGILTLRQKPEKEEKIERKGSVFVTGFTLIFLSELGDKTQLATILFATRFPPLLVFLGALAALSLLSLAAIQLGRIFNRPEKKEVIEKIAGGLFIAIGVLFFFL